MTKSKNVINKYKTQKGIMSYNPNNTMHKFDQRPPNHPCILYNFAYLQVGVLRRPRDPRTAEDCEKTRTTAGGQLHLGRQACHRHRSRDGEASEGAQVRRQHGHGSHLGSLFASGRRSGCCGSGS